MGENSPNLVTLALSNKYLFEELLVTKLPFAQVDPSSGEILYHSYVSRFC
jgi:hypothetical protein